MCDTEWCFISNSVCHLCWYRCVGYVGYKIVGVIAYADDLILVAPIIIAPRKLINICKLYATEYNIKFNGSKSKYMLYICRECAVFNTNIFINGDTVEQITSADHFGHKLSIVNKEYYG